MAAEQQPTQRRGTQPNRQDQGRHAGCEHQGGRHHTTAVPKTRREIGGQHDGHATGRQQRYYATEK